MTVNRIAAHTLNTAITRQSATRSATPPDASGFARLLSAQTEATTPSTTSGSSSSVANVFGLVTKPADSSSSSASTSSTSSSTSTTTSADDHPTLESVFGKNVWATSPGGYSSALGSYSYNPEYFATKEAAAKVAQLLGGTVVEQNSMVGSTGPFYQSQPNEMVQLPNGHLVNAGLTATYYTHGWSQSQINKMLGYDQAV